MRTLQILTFALAMVRFSPTMAQVHQAQTYSITDASKKELSPEEFQRVVASGKYQLVDVRTPSEFASGRIGKAVNIDWTADGYETVFAALRKDRPVLLYCHSGGRSEQAMEYLVVKGYRVQHLDGGISAWRKAGYPVGK